MDRNERRLAAQAALDNNLINELFEKIEKKYFDKILSTPLTAESLEQHQLCVMKIRSIKELRLELSNLANSKDSKPTSSLV